MLPRKFARKMEMTPELLEEDRAFSHGMYAQVQSLQFVPAASIQPLAATLEIRKGQLRAIHRKFRKGTFDIEDHVSIYRLHAEFCDLAQHVVSKVKGGATTSSAIATLASTQEYGDVCSKLALSGRVYFARHQFLT